MRGHLIHIGYPKAASTALQAWFGSHPQLAYKPGGIASHYSAPEISRRSALPTEDHVRWLVTSTESLVVPRRDARADESVYEPIVVRRRRVCRRLRAMFGGATILVVTRGFQAIIASGYSQYVRTGGTAPIEKLYRDAGDGPQWEGMRPEDYFDYDGTVAMYADTFGQENVIVLPSELLRDDSRAFLGRLEERLGIDTHEVNPPWLNESLSGPELYWYPRFSAALARATAHLGRPGAAVFNRYRARIGGDALRRPVDALARLAPSRSVDRQQQLPPRLVERCRGRAASFADDPVYAPYADEYLNSARSRAARAHA
jgi:hypothetical protein